MGPEHSAVEAGRIGPNIVLQLEDVVRGNLGEMAWARLLADAKRPDWAIAPPQKMVDERDAHALYRSLFAQWPEVAPALARMAGRQTGDYIIRHRIPSVVRLLLQLLPHRLAVDMLMRSISRHAWTFAGSGQCSLVAGERPQIRIKDNPVRMPDCVWQQGVLNRLFQRLIDPRIRVQHAHIPFGSGEACCFEIVTSGCDTASPVERAYK